MLLKLFQTGKYFPVISTIMFLLFCFPLFSQDSSDLWSEEFFDDAFLFDDEKVLTIVGTIETSQQMEIIEKNDIERRNAADLATLLQDTLNLNITRYGVYGNMTLLNLRGLDSKRLAFLINGIPVKSSLDGGFDIDKIDLNSVERIEVIYGGSDTKYNVSGAMGGVINIITVKKQKPGLKLGASVSNTSVMPGEYMDRSDKKQNPNWEDLSDTRNYAVNAAYGGNNFSISANAFYNQAANHFLFTDYTGKTRRKDNNEVWDSGGTASFSWDFPLYSRLIASSSIHFGDKKVPGSGFSSVVGNQKDLFSRSNLIIDLPRAFHDDLASEISFGWHFARKDYISPGNKSSRHDQQSIILINRWSWYPGEKLILRSGLDYNFAYLDSTEVGNRNRHEGGIYLSVEYKPVRQFLVTPSVKIVSTSEEGFNIVPVPKLGFLWNITDSLAIKNNYFRSFKFPDFQDLYWSGGGGIGNPKLGPEDGWGGDLGFSWRIGNSLFLNSSFFTHWLKDSIHWYPLSGGTVWQPQNVGEAMFIGMESKLRFDIPVSFGPVKKIISSISYQYLLSYLLGFGYNFASDKRIPYSPVHTIGASLEFPWSTGSILVSGQYESMRFGDRPNLVELESYFLLNATVNQKIGKNFAVFGVLRNILNKSYESFYDYPMPGISLTAGLRMEFEVYKPDNIRHNNF